MVSRRLFLWFDIQEEAASIAATDAQQNLRLVCLLHRRVEFIDIGDGLFGHRFNQVAGSQSGRRGVAVRININDDDSTRRGWQVESLRPFLRDVFDPNAGKKSE
jgi:hypothetical protein